MNSGPHNLVCSRAEQGDRIAKTERGFFFLETNSALLMAISCSNKAWWISSIQYNHGMECKPMAVTLRLCLLDTRPETCAQAGTTANKRWVQQVAYLYGAHDTMRMI